MIKDDASVKRQKKYTQQRVWSSAPISISCLHYTSTPTNGKISRNKKFQFIGEGEPRQFRQFPVARDTEARGTEVGLLKNATQKDSSVTPPY